jgi:predicted DNA-binding protein
MSIADNGSTRGGVKTLAIRLEPDMHAQLSVVAQLRNSTITDEIRQAIEAHIALAVADPDFASQATGVLDEIEREAKARRAAITSLFTSSEANQGRGGTKTRASTTPAD